MDLDSLEAMLVSFDTIPDVVFNYLQDADPAEDQTLTLVVRCPPPFPETRGQLIIALILRCLLGFQVFCSSLTLSWAPVLGSQR